MQRLHILWVIIISITMGLTFMVSAQEAVEEMCIPMGTLVIEPPVGVTSKRASVDFPHSRHFEYTCNSCHHKWDYEEPIVGCVTSGCHDVTEPPKKGGSRAEDKNLAMRYYKDAYHQICLSCHRAIRKKNIEEEKKIKINR